MGFPVPVAHLGHNAGGGGGVDLTSGLLAAWDLDVDMNDDGPNGYNLASAGSPALGTYNGRTGLRISDGNHAYANAASAPLLNEMTEFTVAFWASSVGSAAAGLVNNAYAWSAQKRWMITTTTGFVLRLQFRDSTLGNFTSSDGTTVLTSSTWRHIIVTVSETAKRARAYVNNTLEIDFDFTGYTMQTGSSWGFGLGGDGDGGGTSTECPCDLSRVFVWDHTLDADHRAAIYNGGSDLKFAGF